MKLNCSFCAFVSLFWLCAASACTPAGTTLRDGMKAKDKGNLDVALTDFRTAAFLSSSGNLKVFAAAQNEAGCLLLSLGRPKEAVDCFKQIQFDAKTPALYVYNYACALDAAGESQLAFAQYQKAITGKGLPKTVMASALRAASRSSPRPISDTAKLAESLLDQREFDAAGDYLHSAILIWGAKTPNEFGPLIPPLLRYYALAVDPDEFVDRSRRLDSIALKNTKLDILVKLIHRAYSSTLPAEFGKNSSALSFEMPDDQKPAMSALLRHIADARVLSGEPKSALGHYSLAYELDSKNIEAAIAYANLLDDRTNQLDPDRLLLSSMIKDLFDLKQGIYKLQNLKDGDKQRLVRLHSILGTIFEHENKIGDRFTVESAFFQWSRAAELQAELIQAKSAYVPAAQIDLNYGKVLQLKGDRNGAWSEFLKAAEIATKSLDRSTAKKAIDACEILGNEIAPPVHEANQLQQLKTNLNAWNQKQDG